MHTWGSALAPYRPRATPLVFVHGLVISGAYMLPTAERLAPWFPVLVPDLPGFGRSEKPSHVLSVSELADALKCWMDALGIGQAVIVANSFGCQVSVELSVRHPAYVKCAVLIAPTMDRWARHEIRQIGRTLLDEFQERPSLWFLQLRDLYRAGPVRAWQTFRYALADRIEAKLPYVRVPTLVVRGSRDPIVPQRWSEEVALLLPAGRLVVIPGAAHALNYTSADRLVKVIRTFLAP